MNTRIIVGRSAAIIGIAVGVYGVAVYRKVSPVKSNHITTLDSVSELFANSRTIREIVNPRQHKISGDSRTITLEIPPNHRDISDEVLLAQFTKAFFCGKVFTIERFFLTNIGFDAGKFTSETLSRNDVTVVIPSTNSVPELPPPESRQHISQASQFSDKQLVPRNTTIFSLFHAADVNINPNHSTAPSNKSETVSYIDIAFGSDTRRFSGAHRFSITREGRSSGQVESQQEPTKVQVGFESLTCNPIQADAKPKSYSQILVRFHRIYALLLFREAVAGVKDWLAQS